MSQPTNVCTYDQVPPKRPLLADLQRGLKTNVGGVVPSDATYPSAEEFNQQAAQIAAIGKVMPVCRFTMQGSVVPVILSQSSALLVEPVLTCTRNSSGDNSVTWPANTFPAAVFDATAAIINDVDATVTCVPITNGVRIRTRVAGVLTAANVAVTVG